MKLFNIYAKTATINTITKTLADTFKIPLIAAVIFFSFFYIFGRGTMVNEILIATIAFLSLLIPIFFIVFVSERLEKIPTAKRILPKEQSYVCSIELLDSVVKFNFADKNMNMTYPYEMFKSTHLELYCHEYLGYSRYGRKKALLLILTLTFNFPDGRNISITPLPLDGSETFTGNFEMDFSVYKIIDFLIKSGNFKYTIDTPYGTLPNNDLPDTDIKKEETSPYADWPQKIEKHIEKNLDKLL